MTDSRQSEELQQLSQQVAALTRRVFHLEQLLRAGGTIESSVEKTPPLRVEAAQLEVSPAVAQAPPPRDFSPPAMPPDLPAPQRLPKIPAQSASPEVSLESRIGGQWLNRIGIVAVLVGLSYFLKLAIENDWIGPGTRIAIGLIAGVGLIRWSERFRARAFTAFAYSLKAIGIGALYLSLWAAFQFYHLVSAPVAFFAMILVTAGSVAMSLRQNSELLAAFALVEDFSRQCWFPPIRIMRSRCSVT